MIDISDPKVPKEVGYLMISTHDVYVYGNYCYIATGVGLSVIDVSDPSTPKEIGTVKIPGSYSLQVLGKYAYVAASENGLRIIDISDPGNPKEISYCDTPGIALEVYVFDTYAYVADYRNGLRVIDISDPKAPMEAGFFDIPKKMVRGINVSKGLAYVACEELLILDVLDPKNPREIASYVTWGEVKDVQVYGKYAYVADGDLRVIDISAPSNPKELEYYYDCPGGAGSVQVSGKYAYLADKDGLRVIDVSNPMKLEEIGFCSIPGDSRKISLNDGYAYIVSHLPNYDPSHGWITRVGNLHIIRISEPGKPQEVSFYDVPGIEQDVYALGGYAYVVADKLYVIDISDPIKPREVSSCQLPIFGSIVDYGNPPRNIMRQFKTIFVSGSYAYVANNEGGLRIIDVSNPKAPKEVGFSVDNSANGVYVVENLAYVISRKDHGLIILDVSDPKTPRKLAFCELYTNSLYGVYVFNSTLAIF